MIQFRIASHFCRETTIENNQFSKFLQLIYSSDKAFKGTVVNRALPSLHGGSHLSENIIESDFKGSKYNLLPKNFEPIEM